MDGRGCNWFGVAPIKIGKTYIIIMVSGYKSSLISQSGVRDK